MDFFTADLHIGHTSILKFTERGELWTDIEAHDRAVIEILNWDVGPKDDLYIMGDLSFLETPWLTMHVMSRLKCQKIHLILGNHDYGCTDAYLSSGMFKTVQHRLQKMFNVDGRRQMIVMDHFPMLQWNKGHVENPAWHLHGHAHGDLDYSMFNMQDFPIMDVGFDAAYKTFGAHRAFTYADIESTLKDRTPFPRTGRATRE